MSAADDRLRVAQVMAGAAEGGAELFFERLCAALHGDTATILPIIRRNEARAEVLRASGMAPVQLGFGPPFDVATTLRLRRALRRFMPSVAVFWMSRANQHRPRGPWTSVGRLGGYYDLRHYRGCDHLVGNTQGIVAWLRGHGWPAERTHHLPNFTADFGATSPADLAPLRVPRGERILLALGRLHTDKGFDTLLRALPAISRATLLIAGSGPEREFLSRLAGALGVADRVRFLGWRGDAGALLRAADLFVCPSRVEPLGNVVIEAWSAARPVVAAAAAGPAELIADGTDGVLVPTEEPAALAAAITALLDDPDRAAALAAAGRRRYATEFTRDVVTNRWRAFLAAISPR